MWSGLLTIACWINQSRINWYWTWIKWIHNSLRLAIELNPTCQSIPLTCTNSSADLEFLNDENKIRTNIKSRALVWIQSLQDYKGSWSLEEFWRSVYTRNFCFNFMGGIKRKSNQKSQDKIQTGLKTWHGAQQQINARNVMLARSNTCGVRWNNVSTVWNFWHE